jgi:hypothetical protein
LTLCPYKPGNSQRGNCTGSDPAKISPEFYRVSTHPKLLESWAQASSVEEGPSSDLNEGQSWWMSLANADSAMLPYFPELSWVCLQASIPLPHSIM